jgi:DNA-binding transcriptional MerR regulator
MGKYGAIPQGYMTVGELAKKMNTTVRTLQYHDRENLLPPSAESEGGRRLYTDKDMVRLHQILSMKYLGFSLGDIKNRLVSLDTPADVAGVLAEQAQIVREKINTLSEALRAMETLRAEALQMQTVDFKKYADIVMLLQMKNEIYWAVKNFSDKMLGHIESRFDGKGAEAVITTWKRLLGEAVELKEKGTPPESERGMAFAREYWDMVMNFTGGDMSLLPDLLRFNENKEGWDDAWREKQAVADGYISEALEAYFKNQGYDPFKGGSQ